MRTTFDPEKAVEVILYIAPKIGGDMYNTLKILYLAEKQHLSDYGSLILGDWYIAMEYGPVASNSYDILKFVRGDKEYDAGAPHARESFQIKDNVITSKRDADLSLLSRSDRKCLDLTIKEHGHKEFDELRQLTHDAAYDAAGLNGSMDLHAIAATLTNGAEVNQYLSDPYPD
ncbi:MAG: SocA family protein [Gammaproteobacteria bacterium]|nr:SocA family protein [Gammaproteobacteria bacterium]